MLQAVHLDVRDVRVVGFQVVHEGGGHELPVLVVRNSSTRRPGRAPSSMDHPSTIIGFSSRRNP